MKFDDAKSLSPLKAARRGKILDVAEGLFTRQGHRATTMEGVAEDVGMSKVTVYGYFNDKDALFAAVAARLADRLARTVSEALNQPGPLAPRISNALIAKHTIVFDVVRSSAFATELFAAKDTIVAESFARLDNNIIAQFAACLIHENYAKDRADILARIMFGAADGIASHAKNLPEAKEDIAILIEALLKAG